MKRTLGFVLATLLLAAGGWLLSRSSPEQDAQATAGAEAAEAAARRAGLPLVPPAPATELVAGGGSSATERVALPGPEADAKPTDAEDSADGPLLVALAVSKDTGEPLAGVRFLLKTPGNWLATLTTEHHGNPGVAPVADEEGRATFDLAAGVRYVLHAQGEGEVGEAKVQLSPFAPGERREVRVEVPIGPDLPFWGRVVARDGQRPVAGASVVFGESSMGFSTVGGVERTTSSFDEDASTTTDADGWFELRLSSWKGLEGRVAAEGYGPARLDAEGEHATRASARLVELSRAGLLAGSVRDRTGTPLDGLVARVTANGWDLDPSTRRPPPDLTWEASVDAGGTWEIGGLPASISLEVELFRGDARVWLATDGVELRPGERRLVETVLGSGARVTGRAFLAGSGEPLAGLELWLVSEDSGTPGFLQPYGDPAKRVRTDAAGSFVFEDVAPGEWAVGPAPERSDWDPPQDDIVAPVAAPVVVAAGETPYELRLELHRGLYVRGRVVDPEGSPVDEANVHAYSQEALAFVSTQSREDGGFALGPLVPGTWKVEAARFGSDLSKSDSVTAQPGDAEIVLRLGRGGTIRGVVHGAPSGEPLMVLACSDDGPSSMAFTEDGAFELVGLAPGTYSLSVSNEELAARVDELVLGPDEVLAEVTLELAPGAVLVLRYAGAVPQVVAGLYAGDALLGYEAATAGEDHRVVVAPGELTVTLLGPNPDDPTRPVARSSRTVLATAGEETVVELTDP